VSHVKKNKLWVELVVVVYYCGSVHLQNVRCAIETNALRVLAV